MQLATWMKQQRPVLSARNVSDLYNKRFKGEVSRQLMLQYANGHPMPPGDVRKNLEKLTGGNVTERDWESLARKLGKVKLGSGRWKRPSGTLKKAEPIIRVARGLKAPKTVTVRAVKEARKRSGAIL